MLLQRLTSVAARGVYLAILFLGASGLSRAESFIYGYPGERSYVVGEEGVFCLTTDQANTWSIITTPDLGDKGGT